MVFSLRRGLISHIGPCFFREVNGNPLLEDPVCEGVSRGGWSLVAVQLPDDHDDQPRSSGEEDEDEVGDSEGHGVGLGAGHFELLGRVYFSYI